MKTRIYCLASAKGGSGKTILCASFAAFLTELGKRVLIVDVDAATNGMTLLYLNEIHSHRQEAASGGAGDPPQGLFDTGEFSLERDVVKLANGMSLVPATFSFSIKDNQSEVDLESRLKSLLVAVEDRFDYVFLDAQAGADSYSRAAMSRDVSDEVVIVSEYDPLSAAGVERLKAILRDDLSFDRTWVLLNKILPEFAATFTEFLEVSKYLTPIPWDADVVRAYVRRRLALDFVYGNHFTLAVMQSLRRLLGEASSTEISMWADGRASSIRGPIEEQYRDAEMDLKGLLLSKVRLDSREANRRLLLLVPFGLATIMGVTLISLGTFDSLGQTMSSLALASVAALGVLGVTLYSRMFSGRWSAEARVAEARLARQLSITEDRLKKLEILRKADLETLVKEAPKSF